jgi:hypothetical protein
MAWLFSKRFAHQGLSNHWAEKASIVDEFLIRHNCIKTSILSVPDPETLNHFLPPSLIAAVREASKANEERQHE